MATAVEHLQAGELDQAVAAALSDVKKNPTDVGLRGYLCELLCLAGDLERADKQLETITNQDPKSAAAISLFRQLVRAETARRECFEKGRVPELLDLPDAQFELHMKALLALREGNGSQAAELLTQAEEQRPRVSGTCGNTKFEDMRDCDDLIGPYFEVLTSTGKYYWIPMHRVESMEFESRERTRELLWPRVHMVVKGGPDGEVFLPAIYPTVTKESDAALKLGRYTDWQGVDGEPVRGEGLRTYLIGEETRTIHDLHTLTFDNPQGSPDPEEVPSTETSAE